MRPEDEKSRGRDGIEPDTRRDAGEDRVGRLLEELRPVDLPPFYRTRLLARLRESRRRSWAERLRTPQVAWAVAGASVVALFVILFTTRTGEAPFPGVPRVDSVPGGDVAAIASGIEPVMPADNAVVSAGDVEIMAAIHPPVEGGIIRLFVDERDVTGLAEVTESYVMYSPGERFEEGEHIVTIEIRDGSGRKLTDMTWLFHTLNGRRTHPPEPA